MFNPQRAAEWHEEDRYTMLYWALVFLVVGLVAALLGFTSIAGASFAIAKFIAVLALIAFVVFLVLGITVARKITS